MIILDTCVIRGMGLDSSEADVLRAIKRTKTERVGAPWMAIEELAAQQALEYLDAHAGAVNALRELQRKSYQPEPLLGDPDVEAVRRMCRETYGELLEVLPTSDTATREGLYREANVLPPAGRKGKVKVGSRDVAIWLTAVEYARDHPEETVYFVSGNHRDFTKGEADYPPPMDTDVEEFGDRFVHLTSLSELLEIFAPRADADERDVRGLLELHAEYVAARAATWTGFTLRTESGDLFTARKWVRPKALRAKLIDVQDVKAYRLGGTSWIVATARWQIVDLAIAFAKVEIGACVWETRILIPAHDGNDHSPAIIASDPPLPMDDVSAVEWNEVLNWRLARRAFDMMEAGGRTPTLAESLMSLALAFQPAQQMTLPPAVEEWFSETLTEGEPEDESADDKL
ncbi:PIN domain-containing protein [Streptomyces sp. NPDC024062]|uniref:PIN domain-containing protein n=1 Tax=unclassified Streptomyces TaxID=2593676 RepID=UPI003434076C